MATNIIYEDLAAQASRHTDEVVAYERELAIHEGLATKYASLAAQYDAAAQSLRAASEAAAFAFVQSRRDGYLGEASTARAEAARVRAQLDQAVKVRDAFVGAALRFQPEVVVATSTKTARTR